MTSVSRLAIALSLVALAGCGTAPAPSASRVARTPFPEQGTEERPGRAASPVPDPEESPRDVYASEAGGWSIVVPDGWELVGVGPDGTDAMLTRGEAIAEILVTPAEGLTLDELQAQQVDFLSGWLGARDVASEIVRLPAGQFVRGSLETTDPPFVFVVYGMESGDSRYGISVRGPKDAGDLEAVANAIAESFAIRSAPVASEPQPVCDVSETTPIGPNRIPAWGDRPLYAIGPMAGPNPGPRRFTLVFFRAAGSDDEFTVRGEDAITRDPLRFAQMRGGEARGDLGPTLQLTDATAEDASEMGRGWVSWMVAVELNTSGCYTVRAAEGLFGDEIEFTIRIG